LQQTILGVTRYLHETNFPLERVMVGFWADVA